MKTWKAKVRNVYSSLEELQHHDSVYEIAKRCGYKSCKTLWEKNPMIGGSTDPKDFGIVKAKKKKLSEGTFWGATKVWARKATQAGRITGATRLCNLEGCNGLRISVRWASGKVTFPCSKGLKVRKDGQLQII